MQVTFLHYPPMKQSLFEEFHTLFNLPLYITVTCPQWLGDLATESSKLTAHSIDLINAW